MTITTTAAADVVTRSALSDCVTCGHQVEPTPEGDDWTHVDDDGTCTAIATPVVCRKRHCAMPVASGRRYCEDH